MINPFPMLRPMEAVLSKPPLSIESHARDFSLRRRFCPAPGCSPSRASILTGRNIWQNREAGTHASNFPSDLKVFTRALEEEAEYRVGYMLERLGDPAIIRSRVGQETPLAKLYNRHNMESPKGISGRDYARNFEEFLQEQPSEKPFFFWFGAHEPHRAYEDGAGLRAGKNWPEVAGISSRSPDHSF